MSKLVGDRKFILLKILALHKNWCMHKLQASIYSTIHLTTSLRQHDILQSPAEHPLRAHPAGTSAYHTAYSLSSCFRGIKAHTPKFVRIPFFKENTKNISYTDSFCDRCRRSFFAYFLFKESRAYSLYKSECTLFINP